MIDRNAVMCVGIGVLVLLIGWAVLMLMDWIGGSKPVRPLKEKSRQKKRTRRAPQFDASDDSRFRRPGGSEQQRPAMPLFGEGKPRHVRIDNTPHVIIPHQTVGPTPGHASYRRSMPAVKIKPVDVTPEQQPSNKDKPNKSNRTIPLKRIP